jgi:hypothetical protein
MARYKFEQFEIAAVGEVSSGFFFKLLSSGSQTVIQAGLR